jgi:hypothetical protein
MGNYTVTVEKLAPKADYDVTVFLDYAEGGMQKAVFTKTYKVTTK